MINNLLAILFYIFWIPTCLILVGGVVLWAVLYTWFGYIILFIKKMFR